MTISPVRKAWSKLAIGLGTVVWGICFALLIAQGIRREAPVIHWYTVVLIFVSVQMASVYGNMPFLRWFFFSARRTVFVLERDKFKLNGRTNERREPIFIYVSQSDDPLRFWVGISYNTRRFPFARKKDVCVCETKEEAAAYAQQIAAFFQTGVKDVGTMGPTYFSVELPDME